MVKKDMGIQELSLVTNSEKTPEQRRTCSDTDTTSKTRDVSIGSL